MSDSDQEKISDFIIRYVSSGIGNIKADTSLADINRVQMNIQNFFTEKDFCGLSNYIEELETRFETEFKDARSYAKLMSAKAQSTRKDTKISMEDGLYHAFRQKLEDNRRQCIYLDDVNMDYDGVKRLLRQVISDEFSYRKEEEVVENRFVFPFLVTNNFSVSGEVLLKTSDTAQSVVLLSLGYKPTPKKDVLIIRLFGEKTKQQNLINYSENFHVYTFISDVQHSYIIMSKDPIPEGHCKINGMLVDMPDEIKMGATATAITNLSVIFVTSAKSDMVPLTESKFKKTVENWNHEVIAQHIFGFARHPEFFEKLIIAWMFSGKFSDYPLHLGWIGPTGSTKSYTLESIIESQMQENKWDGTTATVASLIPSYGGNLIDPGYILRQRRVGAADEFFTGFVRSSKKNRRFGEEAGMMTSLLEHKKVPLGSGKHTMVYSRARAKFIFGTNPEASRLSTMTDCAKQLPRQFLSRFLWYVQTKQHINYITERKSKIDRMGATGHPTESKAFMKVYDYLNSFTVEIELGAEDKIYNRYKDILPDELLQEVYRGRTHHHILCLIDGMAKYNSIIESREKIICTQKDIDDADSIFWIIISSLNSNVDIAKMPVETRAQYMPSSAQQIYDILCTDQPLTVYQMEKQSRMSSTSHWIKELVDVGLIKSYMTEKNGKTIKHYVTYNVDPTINAFLNQEENGEKA